MAAAIPPVDRLVFKGTHNSYDQRRKTSEADQAENYGVWVIELDYSVMNAQQMIREATEAAYGNHPAWYPAPPAPPPCVMGHDGPGVCADDAGGVFFGGPDFLLRDTLNALAGVSVREYRPLIIYLDKKNGLGDVEILPAAGLPQLFDRCDDPAYDDPKTLYCLVAGELTAAFGPALFKRSDLAAFRQQAGRAPTIPELAGRVIAISCQAATYVDEVFHEPPEGPDATTPGLASGVIFGDYADESGTCAGPGLPANPVAPPHVYRMDNFTDEWTWDFAVPPNPLVVDPKAVIRMVVGCSEDDGVRTQGAPHGTALMPYPTIARAAARASGALDSGRQGGPGQCGYGFTVLARPGSYADKMTIDFPLTIQALKGELGQ